MDTRGMSMIHLHLINYRIESSDFVRCWRFKACKYKTKFIDSCYQLIDSSYSGKPRNIIIVYLTKNIALCHTYLVCGFVIGNNLYYLLIRMLVQFHFLILHPLLI